MVLMGEVQLLEHLANAEYLAAQCLPLKKLAYWSNLALAYQREAIERKVISG